MGLAVSPGLGRLGHLDAMHELVVHVSRTVVVPVRFIGALEEVAVG